MKFAKTKWVSINSIINNPSNPNPVDASTAFIKGRIAVEGFDVRKGTITVEEVDGQFFILSGHNRIDLAKSIAELSEKAYKEIYGKVGLYPVEVVSELTEENRHDLIHDTHVGKEVTRFHALSSLHSAMQLFTAPVERANKCRGELVHLLAPSSRGKFNQVLDSINNFEGDKKAVTTVASLIKGHTQLSEYVFCGSTRLHDSYWQESYPADDCGIHEKMLGLGRPLAKLLADCYKEDGNDEGESFNAMWDKILADKLEPKAYTAKMVSVKDFRIVLSHIKDASLKSALANLILEVGDQESAGNCAKVVSELKGSIELNEVEEVLCEELTEATELTGSALDVLSQA